MSDEPSPKVVDMLGRPADVRPDTDPELLKIIDTAREIMCGEKHLAIGIVLVDSQKRVTTNFLIKGFSVHSAISGASLLLRRMQDSYEDPPPPQPNSDEPS